MEFDEDFEADMTGLLAHAREVLDRPVRAVKQRDVDRDAALDAVQARLERAGVHPRHADWAVTDWCLLVRHQPGATIHTCLGRTSKDGLLSLDGPGSARPPAP